MDRKAGEAAVAEAVVTRGLSQEEIDDLREAFSNFDRNNDGSIDKKELAVVLRSLGYFPSSSQLEKMMKKARHIKVVPNACELLHDALSRYDVVFSVFFLAG